MYLAPRCSGLAWAQGQIFLLPLPRPFGPRPHTHTPGRRERRHRTAVSRHMSAPRPRLRDRRSLHDFMMLNPLRQRAASTAAIEQAVHVLRKALGTN